MCIATISPTHVGGGMLQIVQATHQQLESIKAST